MAAVCTAAQQRPEDQVNARKLGEKGGIRLSRANAAAFMLQQATDSRHIGEAPFISDKEARQRHATAGRGPGPGYRRARPSSLSTGGAATPPLV
ncbi:hypothetical protein [Streptomyces sp. NPDC060035]|uniref:hypothetical protein n=1 Tax=Streptomyces sp. NPDC060035 TaxID=3347044 RepID=UPI003685F9C6